MQCDYFVIKVEREAMNPVYAELAVSEHRPANRSAAAARNRISVQAAIYADIDHTVRIIQRSGINGAASTDMQSLNMLWRKFGAETCSLLIE